MSASKPRIRPKTGPRRQRSELPLHDPPTYLERSPPAFAEREPGTHGGGVTERVVFHEDDCLR